MLHVDVRTFIYPFRFSFSPDDKWRRRTIEIFNTTDYQKQINTQIKSWISNQYAWFCGFGISNLAHDFFCIVLLLTLYFDVNINDCGFCFCFRENSINTDYVVICIFARSIWTFTFYSHKIFLMHINWPKKMSTNRKYQMKINCLTSQQNDFRAISTIRIAD